MRLCCVVAAKPRTPVMGRECRWHTRGWQARLVRRQLALHIKQKLRERLPVVWVGGVRPYWEPFSWIVLQLERDWRIVFARRRTNVYLVVLAWRLDVEVGFPRSDPKSLDRTSRVKKCDIAAQRRCWWRRPK